MKEPNINTFKGWIIFKFKYLVRTLCLKTKANLLPICNYIITKKQKSTGLDDGIYRNRGEIFSLQVDFLFYPSVTNRERSERTHRHHLPTMPFPGQQENIIIIGIIETWYDHNMIIIIGIIESSYDHNMIIIIGVIES